jgi:nucleoside-diphosphate-sugar epimerase
VDDVVDALLLAMITEATNGEVYNLGGEPLSLIRFVEALLEENGGGDYELVEFPGDLKAIEIGDYIASYEKFKNLTGWQPRVPLHEGLALTLDYYRENRPHYWGD